MPLYCKPSPGFYILLLLAGLIFFPASVDAQDRNFSPASQDDALLTRLSQKYQQHYQQELEQLPSKNKKDLTTVYNERWKSIKERFDKKEIYTSPVAQAYLDKLVAEIKKGNASLNGLSFDCYFSRTDIPNAAYIGEGIILFNMGLFQRLHDESEVAYVLCHEISHYLLRHSENGIHQYVEMLNAEETQEELRKIKGSEYHKREQIDKLVKGLTFDSRRHSRDHEAQADSMAVVLMHNTKFAMKGALTALALLDVIDRDTLNMSACLKETFDATDYPFRKKWIARDNGLLGGHAIIKEDTLSDSLKTHPDCQLRIKLLSPYVKNTPQVSPARFVTDSAAFFSLQRTFRYEVIEYAFLSNNYTKSLFRALELLRTSPGDVYLVSQIGRILCGVYNAQKAHTLGKVIDLPAPGYPESYNLLLQFIQNLYLEDIASIDYYYLNQYHPQMDPYVPFKTAYEQSQRMVKQ